MKLFNIIFLVFFSLVTLLAQENSSPILDYRVKHANRSYEKREYVKAEPKYEKLLEKRALSDHDKAKYADVLLMLGQFEKSVEVLRGSQEMSELGAKTYYDANVRLGNEIQADSILASHPEIVKFYAEDHIASTTALKALPERKDIELTLLDINSATSDYSPVLYDDTLYFTSSRFGKTFWRGTYSMTGEFYQDVYKVSNGKAVPLSKEVNKPYHDGPIAFSEDGSFMIVCRNGYSFSNYGNQKESFNELQLYKSDRKSDGTWSEPKKLSICQEEYYYTHPSIRDNNLYFASNIPGGYGKSDIYYVSISADGDITGDIVNLGKDINTMGNDAFPFMDAGEQLYFASDSRPGFGGLDIYKAQKDGSGYVVSNMGKSFNSTWDDFAFISTDDRNGYFTSNREGGKGSDDIYKYKMLVPFNVRVVDGESQETLQSIDFSSYDKAEEYNFEESTGEDGLFTAYIDDTIKNAHFNVKESYDYLPFDADLEAQESTFIVPLEPKSVGVYGCVCDVDSQITFSDVRIVISSNDSLIGDVYTDDRGQYKQNLTRGLDYKLVAVKEGYFPLEDSLSAIDKIGWIERNFVLSDMIELEGILYEFDKHNITPESEVILDYVVELMNTYLWINIELGSHTDVRGSMRYNEALSQRRSEAAVEYVVNKGIAPDRIVAKGYGETQLKNKCATGVWCSPEEHHQNRRTEIRIIK